MRLSRLWLIVLILLTFASPIWAQDSASDTPALLDMLALVPDSPSAREYLVSYVNYRAVEAARPGALQADTWADWEAARQADDAAFDPWMAAFQGISSGPIEMLQLLFVADNWPQVIGFDFFEIDQALEYGQPPSMVQVLQGDFNAEAIVSAYEAREFSVEARGDLTLLCGGDGCDNGMALNMDRLDQTNPFGGRFGRQEPLLIAPGHLVDSADIAQVDQHIALLEGEAASLADDAQFQAAARVAAREGLLIQVQFANAALLGIEGDNGASIPAYDLLVLADAATESEQVVSVGLVYASAADAQAAAEALPARIESYQSIVRDQPFLDILAERNAAYTVEVFEDETSGAAVAVVVLRGPLAGAEAVDGRLPSSSQIFRLLVQMLYQRDLGWMVP
ncbi:MAG: hypothetical protein KC547_06025 [Anaerolineae bacterium]|nr:hypothetical protein [Anaerolineae bacterium]